MRTAGHRVESNLSLGSSYFWTWSYVNSKFLWFKPSDSRSFLPFPSLSFASPFSFPSFFSSPPSLFFSTYLFIFFFAAKIFLTDLYSIPVFGWIDIVGPSNWVQLTASGINCIYVYVLSSLLNCKFVWGRKSFCPKLSYYFPLPSVYLMPIT